jgi:hypothetical protein
MAEGEEKQTWGQYVAALVKGYCDARDRFNVEMAARIDGQGADGSLPPLILAINEAEAALAHGVDELLKEFVNDIGR